MKLLCWLDFGQVFEHWQCSDDASDNPYACDNNGDDGTVDDTVDDTDVDIVDGWVDEAFDSPVSENSDLIKYFDDICSNDWDPAELLHQTEKSIIWMK